MRIRSFAAAAALAVCATTLAGVLTAAPPKTPSPRPYPLITCPISDHELGDTDDQVIKVYDGREVRFCSKRCARKFAAKPGRYWTEIDTKIATEQRMHYPFGECIVSGDPLAKNGKDNATELVYDNRLIRLCSDGCQESFTEDPQGYMTTLDQRIADAQRDNYPLTDCVVTGMELGSMGEPVEIVFENRLVRFCCDGCLDSFHADPHKYMAMIDTAYADAQRDSYPLTECPVTEMELGSMGEVVELVAGTTLVRFCCEGCFVQFKDNPAPYLAMLREPDE